MRHPLAIGLAVAATCTASLLGACTGDDEAAPTARPGDRVAIDSDVAGVELVGFDDEVVDIGDYGGRPLVINVFASWCAPCVSEMPVIERVKQDVDGDVAFLGIATNDRVEDALALIEDTGITWDVARDPQGEAASELGVVNMPTTFLVSLEGEVVEHHGGEIAEHELRALIAEHFGIET